MPGRSYSADGDRRSSPRSAESGARPHAARRDSPRPSTDRPDRASPAGRASPGSPNRGGSPSSVPRHAGALPNHHHQQLLEHETRTALRRQRRRRRRPRECGAVRAAVSGIASAGDRVRQDRELERRQRRIFLVLRGNDLIDRGTRPQIRPFGALDVGPGKPRRGAARVIAVPVAKALGSAIVQAADDHHLLTIRLERAEDRRELEVGANRLRLPVVHAGVVHRHPVRHVEESEALRRLGRHRRQRRHHRIQIRQRQ